MAIDGSWRLACVWASASGMVMVLLCLSIAGLRAAGQVQDGPVYSVQALIADLDRAPSDWLGRPVRVRAVAGVCDAWTGERGVGIGHRNWQIPARRPRTALSRSHRVVRNGWRSCVPCRTWDAYCLRRQPCPVERWGSIGSSFVPWRAPYRGGQPVTRLCCSIPPPARVSARARLTDWCPAWPNAGERRWR